MSDDLEIPAILFLYGDRAKLSPHGLARLGNGKGARLFNEETRATVIGRGLVGSKLRLLRDGLRTPETFHVSYWTRTTRLPIKHVGTIYAICDRRYRGSFVEHLGVERFRRLGIFERFAGEAPYRVCPNCIEILQEREK